MTSSAPDGDFLPDPAGLTRAVELLLTWADASSGPPVPDGADLPLPAALPEAGSGPETALETLAPVALGGASRLGAPGFFAHMDPPTPWMTWAAAMWAASLNQNLLHPDTSPAARRLEERAVAWLAPFYGMSGGHLVPGSSVANLTALWAARELRGIREVVCSDMAHLSVRKAANMLGLRYRTVEAGEDHRIQEGRLGDLSEAALVLTAGTVASGAVDPLALSGRARWTHVDAAWSGPMRLSDTHASVLQGVEAADSVSISLHKWLFQPKESALILFSDVSAAHDALSFGGGYLSVPNIGVLGSHGGAALPLVTTLLAWGREGVARRVDLCMSLAERLAQRAADAPEVELFARPGTGVLLWRPADGQDPAAVRARMRESFVSVADVRGQRWWRSVGANPMAVPDLVADDAIRAIRAAG